MWLERAPESFIPGFDFDEESARLPRPTTKHLRWDTKAIHAAVNARRGRSLPKKQAAGARA